MRIFRLLQFLPIFLCSFLIAHSSYAQTEKEEKLNRILFLLDASGSMHGNWESGMKIKVAKRLLGKIIDSLSVYDNLEVALRVYGHQSPRNDNDCKDTKLEVPFAPDNAQRIKDKLASINPKGQTPIGYSLLQAASDFPTDRKSRNIIILITDGVESCKEDPCAVSMALQKKGIFLKPFVIGIGLERDYSDYFGCVGSYYDAVNETAFEQVLGVVISQALNTTTTQVNLLDKSGMATETNVNMTFYDVETSTIRYNYVHTLNSRGVPDTLVLDPVYEYNLEVHTIPSIKKKNIKLISGKHNIIPVDAPQGILEIAIEGRSVYKNLQCIVKQADSCRTLNLQLFGAKEKYLVGKYDLEVLTLPRIYLEDVKVSQSHTTTIQIPTPGNITIMSAKRGYGSVYQMGNDELVWVCNLNTESLNQNLKLQPGNYRVVFRSTNAKKSAYTVERDFQVSSGAGASVKIY